uniref:Serine/arginine repetitive matrix protein 1 n=1 Tax=Anopheles gambiae TaxID=7165 RepID=A0A1S4G963_ANOGA
MMSSYRHSTANGDGACDVNNNNSNDDHNNNLLTADNLLRLALKKPKSWNWELTTSSSSPNITFPKIQLFDGASGELMVEVDRPDCVIRSGCPDTVPKSGGSSPSRYRRSRTSLVREKLTTTGDSLADIFSQLQNKGLGHKLTTSGSQYRLLQGAQVDESARGSLQKSKSANAIVVTPEAPPIVRRRSRRSLASRSSSILERISEFYGRSSTEEEDVLPAVPQLLLAPASEAGSPAQDEGVTIEELPADDCPAETAINGPPRPKIYKLVRSNIGTLMVREESFHTQRSLRRRQREAGGERVPSPPELVELDEQTDRPRPAAGGTELDRNRYEREISRIDGLLSRVMLSHDLQTEELARADLGPSIRIEDAPEDVLVREVMSGLSTEHQNGSATRRPRRRSRRSVSVGGSVTSPHRLRSASSSSTSDGEQDRGYRGTRLRGQHRTGSSSRSGSQKRRGRTRHRDPDVGPHATISNAAAAAAPSCRRAATTVPHCPSGRRFSADGGGPDTLALERFRASLARRPDSRDASAITIDVPAIGASASPAAAAATNTRQCAVQPNSGSSSSSSTSASSSGSTLSTLSPWTSGADSETQSPATVASNTATASNYPLGRSISVPCGTPRESSSAEHDFLDRLRRSLVPITGDALRRRYLMEDAGQLGQEQPPPQQPADEAPQQPAVLRRDPPGRRHLRTMSSVVEQVLYTQRAAATSSSSSSHGKPPTGRRTLSPPTSDEPGPGGLAAKRAPEEAPEPPEEPPLSSELANTVEPPYRGRRTLKYYTRRYRTSIHYDNP